MNTSETTVKDNVVVWCKCERIIFASSDLSNENFQEYWDAGYKVGRASTEEVHELYGCKCKTQHP